MAYVVIKLIPRSVCNCNNQPAVAPTVTMTNTPAAAVSAQAATMDPGKIAAAAATSAAATPAEPAEETKKSNWWKWALGGLAVIGLIAATGEKDKKKDNKNRNRR